MNLRKLKLIKSKNEYVPHDRGLYSKLSLYCYNEHEQFVSKIDIQELHISLDYNIYGRQLITVSFKVWWEDSNEYIKPNTAGSFTVRYMDPHKNEMVISDCILVNILHKGDDEFYTAEVYSNNMNYFTKELTHIKF